MQYIQEKMKKMCERGKLTVEEVFYFIVFRLMVALSQYLLVFNNKIVAF